MAKITIDPKIRFGKPCIKGTRITVEDILNLLRAGWAIEEIPEEYPEITKRDVFAALEFAARLTREPTKVMTVREIVK